MKIERKFVLQDGDRKIRLTHVTELRGDHGIEGGEVVDLGLSIDISDHDHICSFMFDSDAEAVSVLERMLKAAKQHMADNQ